MSLRKQILVAIYDERAEVFIAVIFIRLFHALSIIISAHSATTAVSEETAHSVG